MAVVVAELQQRQAVMEACVSDVEQRGAAAMKDVVVKIRETPGLVRTLSFPTLFDPFTVSDVEEGKLSFTTD